jgi:predicted transposase YbfD/YdcC
MKTRDATASQKMKSRSRGIRSEDETMRRENGARKIARVEKIKIFLLYAGK